jgi:hypothetical protein
MEDTNNADLDITVWESTEPMMLTYEESHFLRDVFADSSDIGKMIDDEDMWYFDICSVNQEHNQNSNTRKCSFPVPSLERPPKYVSVSNKYCTRRTHIT